MTLLVDGVEITEVNLDGVAMDTVNFDGVPVFQSFDETLFVTFAGTTGAVSRSKGLTVVRNGVGNYTVSFTEPRGSVDYLAFVRTSFASASSTLSVGAYLFTASNFVVRTWNITGGGTVAAHDHSANYITIIPFGAP